MIALERMAKDYPIGYLRWDGINIEAEMRKKKAASKRGTNSKKELCTMSWKQLCASIGFSYGRFHRYITVYGIHPVDVLNGAEKGKLTPEQESRRWTYPMVQKPCRSH